MYLNDPDLADSMSWWFEFEEVPVKWNWPIGLSYDLLSGGDPGIDGEEELELESEKNYKPWKLVLRYKNYPKEYVLALNENSWEDYWLNQLKEASYIRDGNAKGIMDLSKEDTTNLLKSVKKSDYELYWSIYDRILPSLKQNVKNIPVKLYLPGSNSVHQALVPRTIRNGDDSLDEIQTVGSALNIHLNGLFPSKRTCLVARPLMHGVILPMSTPLIDLLYEAGFTDGFLHISVVMIS